MNFLISNSNEYNIGIANALASCGHSVNLYNYNYQALFDIFNTTKFDLFLEHKLYVNKTIDKFITNYNVKYSLFDEEIDSRIDLVRFYKVEPSKEYESIGCYIGENYESVLQLAEHYPIKIFGKKRLSHWRWLGDVTDEEIRKLYCSAEFCIPTTRQELYRIMACKANLPPTRISQKITSIEDIVNLSNSVNLKELSFHKACAELLKFYSIESFKMEEWLHNYDTTQVRS